MPVDHQTDIEAGAAHVGGYDAVEAQLVAQKARAHQAADRSRDQSLVQTGVADINRAAVGEQR